MTKNENIDQSEKMNNQSINEPGEILKEAEKKIKDLQQVLSEINKYEQKIKKIKKDVQELKRLDEEVNPLEERLVSMNALVQQALEERLNNSKLSLRALIDEQFYKTKLYTIVKCALIIGVITIFGGSFFSILEIKSMYNRSTEVRKKADEFENKIKNEEIEIKKIEENIKTSWTNIKRIWEDVKEYEEKNYDTEIKNAINTKISNDINVNNLKTKVETASETADKLIETYLAKDKTLKEMVNKDKLDEVFGVIKLLSEDAKAIELWNIRINFRGLIILALLASFVSFLIVLFHMFGIFNVIKSKMKKMF